MADSKFVRDLNSLIRDDDRTRIGNARARAPIDSGEGVAEYNEELIGTDDYIYYSTYKQKSTTGTFYTQNVYKYKDLDTPVLVAQEVDHTQFAGYVGNSYYRYHRHPSTDVVSVTLNDNVILTINPVADFVARVFVNSVNIIVQFEGLVAINRHSYFEYYDLTGNYISTWSQPSDLIQKGLSIAYVNNSTVATFWWDSNYKHIDMFNHAGARLATTVLEDDSTIAAEELNGGAHVTLCEVYNFNTDTVYYHVFNSLGVKIATLAEPTGIRALAQSPSTSQYSSAICVTPDRFYYFADANKDASKVIVYNNTLTLDANGVATAMTIGALIGTVDNPNGVLAPEITYGIGYLGSLAVQNSDIKAV